MVHEINSMLCYVIETCCHSLAWGLVSERLVEPRISRVPGEQQPPSSIILIKLMQNNTKAMYHTKLKGGGSAKSWAIFCTDQTSIVLHISLFQLHLCDFCEVGHDCPWVVTS